MGIEWRIHKYVTHGQTDSHTDRATSWAPVGAKIKLENVTEVYWNLTEPESSVKLEHFTAKILAEKSHGSKFDPQILTIWTSTLHCSGDCDFMVTIVTMHLSGAPFRQNSVMYLLTTSAVTEKKSNRLSFPNHDDIDYWYLPILI